MRRVIPWRSRKGLTFIELMIVVALIILLASLVIVSFLRARISVIEAIAIQHMRVLQASVQMYRAGTGQPRPPVWLDDMYGVDCAPSTPPVPDYGPRRFCLLLDNQIIMGYDWSYQITPGTPTGYYFIAVPQIFGVTGTRSFFSNETDRVTHCLGRTVTPLIMAGYPRIDQPPNPVCP